LGKLELASGAGHVAFGLDEARFVGGGVEFGDELAVLVTLEL